MKTFKRVIITLMLFTFITTAVDLPIIGGNVIAQAATLKLNTKSLTLEVGEKKTLKISGATGKVSWNSTKTSVATVSKKGTVTAIAAGNAKITATVAGKKLTCSVTVNEPEYDFVYNAPFSATQIEIYNTSFVMPSDWTISPPSENDDGISVELASSDKNSAMQIYISKTKEEDPDYLFLKGMFSTVLTMDYCTNQWKDNLGDMPFEISNFEQTDYESPFGKAFKVKYTITANGISVNSVIYESYIDGYLVQITTVDADNIDMEAIADYIISSVVIKLALTACNISNLSVPETVEIDGKTYRNGFYGDLWPENLSYKGDTYKDGNNEFYHVVCEQFDWVHSAIGSTINGVLYCAESQWEKACEYYSNSDNFTYYCRIGAQYEGSGPVLATIPNLDSTKFEELIAFADKNSYNPFGSNKDVKTRRLPIPDKNKSPELVFYKESKDEFFTSFQGNEFLIIDGKLLLLFYYDYGHGKYEELVAVDVPDELGKYFIELIARLAT